MRERLTAVRKGEAQQVEGDFPTEVQPLIDDLNTLLIARRKAVTKAQATAADLAHALKTPLALLSGESDPFARIDREPTPHKSGRAEIRRRAPQAYFCGRRRPRTAD